MKNEADHAATAKAQCGGRREESRRSSILLRHALTSLRGARASNQRGLAKKRLKKMTLVLGVTAPAKQLFAQQREHDDALQLDLAHSEV